MRIAFAVLPVILLALSGIVSADCGLPQYDDFSDGNDDGWTHHCSGGDCTWSVDSGVYVLGGPFVTVSTLDATNGCCDYAFEADVQTGSDDGIVVFRFQAVDTCYNLNIRPYVQELTLERRPASSGYWSVPCPSSAHTWYRVRVEAVGSRIKCYVNGTKYIDIVDPDPIFCGPVGLWGHTGQTGHFDDICVIGLAPGICDLPQDDSFSDGDDDGWTHHCGGGDCTWSVESGIYVLGGDLVTVGTLDATNGCCDYAFEADVQTDSNDGIVVFRFQHIDTCYNLNIRPYVQELTLERRPASAGYWSVPCPSSAHTWYRVRVEAVGPSIRCYVDGTKYIDIVDPDPILCGPVGLWGHTNQTGRFDNVRVTEFGPSATQQTSWGTIKALYR